MIPLLILKYTLSAQAYKGLMIAFSINKATKLVKIGTMYATNIANQKQLKGVI